MEDLDRLYTLLDRLESKNGGKRILNDCDGYMDWPDRGVYFFFAPEETRTNSDQLRLTRIGTHAVASGSQASLWNRLRTHRGPTRGTFEGGGSHRASVFRRHVGAALSERDGLNDEYPEWGVGSSTSRELRKAEHDLEQRVSSIIRHLPFLWVEIDDAPGLDSDRAYVERNAIALVSNYGRTPIDSRPDDWLGMHNPAEEIHESGLWNVNHVDEAYDPAFLDILKDYINGSAASQEESAQRSNHAREDSEEPAAATDTTAESDVDMAANKPVEPFAQVWETLLQYAESESSASTLSRGNPNEIRRSADTIEVRNLETDRWREINHNEFQYAYQVLCDEGKLTLDAIEPELAGRKSIVTAILARALDLEYDRRPLTVYR